MRRRAWTFGLIPFVLMAAAALFFHLCVEPEYDGRKLSDWLQQYSPDTQRKAPSEEGRARRREAAEAVRHLGPKALPWLIRWSERGPPTPISKTRVMLWIGGLKPQYLNAACRREKLTTDKWCTQVGLGLRGLEILAEDSNGPADLRCASVLALGELREAALETAPTVIRALSDPDAAVRNAATNALMQIAPTIAEARLSAK